MATKGLNRRHSDEEIERALTTMARVGNVARAAQELGMNVETLYTWKNQTHRDRFEEIRRDVLPQIHGQIASDMEDVAREAARVELAGLALLQDRLPSMETKDLSTAVRNASVTKGVNVQHLLPMRDKPSTIVKHVHAAELLAELERALPVRYDADSVATEMPALDGDSQL